MNPHSKLRWSTGFYYPVVIFGSYILAIIEMVIRKALIRDGVISSSFPFLTYIFVGLFFIGMGIYQWLRYRFWIYPVVNIIIGILCFQAPYAIYVHGYSIFRVTYFITLIILVLFIIINWQAFYGQERFEINSRRLFRLAAELIRDTSGGFTERPYSAGKLTVSKDELLGFSRFLNGKYVARTFHLEDRIYFSFSMNKSLVNLEDPKVVSHVVIDFSGNISVAVAEKDYRDYVNSFSFDQVCSSMAAIFERFLGYYQQGLEARIITELKTAR
jgi:hypothetical protein